ncbi:hypothetical protein TTHERM_00930720 (macronuclear) [Tetrahymena thermophila SB210]|uniref:Uncharacterized protein n=1 Tax=Tetrahymena thermophila (strain SB210) TaxID=312017 RepID=Q24CG9_TETTS|nr:hypothetical protein TTHERM_00930720 [Tetrahymena thermophila SB210]EAS05491.1 hypothetical protein TTHERM_00930720 [Tetrahymena thermophila SB210]|eukprot:XP_001025736.1 hypothetical protein TTHERM_00930720 [Tetrahymena thermophila SB210]
MSCFCKDDNKEPVLMQSISSKMKSSTGLRYSDQLVVNHVIESNLENNNPNQRLECQTLIEKDEKSEEGSNLFINRERDYSSFIIQIAKSFMQTAQQPNFTFPPGLMINSIQYIDENIIEIQYKIFDTEYIFNGKEYQNQQDFDLLDDLLLQYKKNFIGNNSVKSKVGYDETGNQIIYFIAKTTYPYQQSTIIKEIK